MVILTAVVILTAPVFRSDHHTSSPSPTPPPKNIKCFPLGILTLLVPFSFLRPFFKQISLLAFIFLLPCCFLYFSSPFSPLFLFPSLKMPIGGIFLRSLRERERGYFPSISAFAGEYRGAFWNYFIPRYGYSWYY